LNEDGEEISEDDKANDTTLSGSKQKDTKMSKSLNVKFDTEKNKKEKDTGGTSSDTDNNISSSASGSNKYQLVSKGTASLSQSLVLGGTTEGTTSESSVGNSPNPRKTTKKSKKQKKRKF
jgi:hypothetical protein